MLLSGHLSTYNCQVSSQDGKPHLSILVIIPPSGDVHTDLCGDLLDALQHDTPSTDGALLLTKHCPQQFEHLLTQCDRSQI